MKLKKLKLGYRHKHFVRTRGGTRRSLRSFSGANLSFFMDVIFHSQGATGHTIAGGGSMLTRGHHDADTGIRLTRTLRWGTRNKEGIQP
jgi:hypothetical protein